MIKLNKNGDLVIDGKTVDQKDPLSFFSKDAPIMHGRFGTYGVTRRPDPEVHENAVEDEGHDVESDIDADFKVKIEDLVQFDRH